MDRTEGSLYTVVKLNKGIIRYYYTGIEVPSGNECAMNYTISSSGHRTCRFCESVEVCRHIKSKYPTRISTQCCCAQMDAVLGFNPFCVFRPAASMT